MNRIRIAALTALVGFAALFVATPAHAIYLSGYGGGGGRYLSAYGGGGYSYGSSAGYVPISTSGAGSIDRRGATPRTIKIQEINYAPPCGNYHRRPTPCKNVTMAYNPNASVSRTGHALRIHPTGRTYYVQPMGFRTYHSKAIVEPVENRAF